MGRRYRGLKGISKGLAALISLFYHTAELFHSRYFGRAKDLPGVKELFSSRKKDEEEENQSFSYFKKFINQGPAYFGDFDESDGTLLEYEQEAESDGMSELAFRKLRTWCTQRIHQSWKKLTQT